MTGSQTGSPARSPVGAAVERLRSAPALAAAGIRKVDGVFGLAALDGVPAQSTAYVLPLGESGGTGGGAGGGGGGVRQPVGASVGVLLVLRNVKDATALDAWTRPVLEALAGWQPWPDAGPFTYAGGQLADLAPGEVRWLMRFSLQSLLWR